MSFETESQSATSY